MFDALEWILCGAAAVVVVRDERSIDNRNRQWLLCHLKISCSAELRRSLAALLLGDHFSVSACDYMDGCNFLINGAINN